jgi:hypothetical protein
LVRGSGTAGGPGVVTGAFDLDARSGPSGEDATGTASLVAIDLPQLRVEGPVTCLNVSGNRAVIGFDNSLGNPDLGSGMFLDVTDGTPDSLGLVTPGGSPATVCPAPGISPFPPQVLSGDIVVTDAQPLLTTKGQCKHGGWRTFGIFKNQGDCVSSVRKRARQACGEERATIGRAAFRAKYGTGGHRRPAMGRCIRQRIGG